MQVTKHVHAIRIPFQIPVAPGKSVDRFVYSFLIYSGDEICLIDSGVAGSERAIFGYLSKTGRQPKEISWLVLTHSHPDHIGAARSIKEASGCKVAAHPAEREMIENVDLQAKLRPVPGFHSLVGGSVAIDRLLADGDILELGPGMPLEILHTPGHSQGSLSLWLAEDKALFCGDTIPQPGDFPIYENVSALVNSIERLKGLDQVQFLLASWDEPRKGEEVRRVMEDGLRYLARIDEIVHKTAEYSRPDEPVEFCKRVVAQLGLPPSAANPLTARSFAAHLAHRESLPH